MEKEAKKYFVVLISVVLAFSLISSVYAFSFNEFWAKITGQAIANVKCVDTDGGVNYAVKGIVSVKTSIISITSTKYTDSCSWVRDKGTMLTEYSCQGDKMIKQTIACPNCKDGACVQSNATQPSKSITLDFTNGERLFVASLTSEISGHADAYLLAITGLVHTSQDARVKIQDKVTGASYELSNITAGSTATIGNIVLTLKSIEYGDNKQTVTFTINSGGNFYNPYTKTC